MSDEAIIGKIKEVLAARAEGITNPAPKRIFLPVSPGQLVETVDLLKKRLGLAHLATISGVDRGENFEFLYHLVNSDATVTVRILTPRSAPKIPSICSIIPGAILYERELQDMFGVVVENIPDPRPLLLPDNWPQGQFPLRKDWKWERPAEIIPGGGK